MRVVVLTPVRDFVDDLDTHLRAHVYHLVELLEEYGHNLGMPIAKPVGKGLWELRSRTRPAVRILYGLCGGEAVLVHALKKQRSALLSREAALARERLHAYCG